MFGCCCSVVGSLLFNVGVGIWCGSDCFVGICQCGWWCGFGIFWENCVGVCCYYFGGCGCCVWYRFVWFGCYCYEVFVDQFLCGGSYYIGFIIIDDCEFVWCVWYFGYGIVCLL